jgi:DNA-binding IclR family transcriptional regulator
MIQSVHRATQILGLFSFNEPRLGISDISRSLGLHKGTVQGLVRTLTEEGFLQKDEDTRKYQLGLRIYELGAILAGSLEINQKASALAHELAKQTEHLVRIAIPDKDSALITLDAYPRSQPFLSRQFGPRAPLYCTAIGKALLAFWEQNEIDAYLEKADFIAYTAKTITGKEQLLKDLKETRERGYSINLGEHLLARAAVGAPIYGRRDLPLASMCVVVDPSYIAQEEKVKGLAREVMKTALGISELMGFSYRVMHRRQDNAGSVNGIQSR